MKRGRFNQILTRSKCLSEIFGLKRFGFGNIPNKNRKHGFI